MRITNLEGFLYKANEKHGDKYDYSEAIYVSAKTPLTIICRIHGSFNQIPNSHLAGSGCTKCGNARVYEHATRHRLTTEQFITKAKAVHGSKYDYSKVDYFRNSDDVIIACPVHGDFTQRPANHLCGKGCSQCNTPGFSKAKQGHVYLLVSNDSFKIGITNNKVEYRARQISRSQNRNFKVIDKVFLDGSACVEAETELLKWASSKGFYGPSTGDGFTETFFCGVEDISEALDVFTSICSKYEHYYS